MFYKLDLPAEVKAQFDVTPGLPNPSKYKKYSRPKKKEPEGSYKCLYTCSEGNKCVCNGGIEHSLHICKDPKCRCHSRERYENR